MKPRHDVDCGLLYDDGPERCTCSATETVEVALKACPFCAHPDPDLMGADGIDWSIYCDKCCVATCAYRDRAECVAAWNTRSTTAESASCEVSEEVVERVAKAMYDATHAGLRNCYAWDDRWEDHQEPRRDRYYKEARAAIAAVSGGVV